jgi:AcrR family transcriptional regulator
VRNRKKIVDAAREVFAERGVDVALEVVARRADVSPATLSRRFTRAELVEAVFLERAERYLEMATEALDAEPGAGAFAAYLEQVCELHAGDRSAADVLTLRLPDCPGIIELRRRIYATQFELIRRSQAAGDLREDFVPEDVILVVLAVAGVAEATRDSAPQAWRRTLAMLQQSLRPPGDARSAELPAAPTDVELVTAMRPPPRGRPTGRI